MSTQSASGDLPLMSNVCDILVRHYVFDFKCDFPSKCFTCFAVLFLEPIGMEKCLNSKCFCLRGNPDKPQDSHQSGHEEHFALILDCHQITVNAVDSLDNGIEELKFVQFRPSSFHARESLNFSVSEWSLKIWTNEAMCKHGFPKIIRISYVTKPSSPSLMWVNDQNKNPVVYSYGSPVNNRSLFPCQEPPVAMATWEATVSTTNQALVLMSGDEEAHISMSDGYRNFYYYTKRDLPLSTLSLAVGYWEEHRILHTCKNMPKCRILASSNLLDKSVKEFFEYIPYCLQISSDILGPYPFPRIDFLIVPPTFSSLGMASPNIVFLSQSLVCGDGSMCSRVAHEISHAWFGLSIGALDWSEEWLSEGFATFLEDHLHVWTTHMPKKNEYLELKAVLRKKILLDEIENTNDELQIIRPSRGEIQKEMVDGIDSVVLRNGQNPLKGFMQVHYIKGYFLLKYLSDIVGIDAFMNFLKTFISKFDGKLITSKECLEMFFCSFPLIKETLTVETIFEDWLHSSGIPDEVKNLTASPENEMFKEVMEETEKWKKLNSFFLKKRPKKKPKCSLDHFRRLSAEQTILLLENLLDEKTMSAQVMRCLNQVFCFKEENAEIQHRWFELVLKHKYRCEYKKLKEFLLNHVAMGVYLYSEMIYSGNEPQFAIAKECYSLLEEEMEPNFRSTLNNMFLESEGI